MADPRRYNAVAMTLHWLIAALILINIGLAWTFNGLPLGLTPEMHGAGKIALIQLHKPIGIAVLVLSLAEAGLAVHFAAAAPAPFGHGMGASRGQLPSLCAVLRVHDRHAADPDGSWFRPARPCAVYPINFFGGVFHWPAISYFTNMPHDAQHAWHERFTSYHADLAWLAYALLILHVGAALRHQFVKRDTVLWRMAPVVRRPV